MKYVGMQAELLQPDKLFEVNVDREVKAVLVNRASLLASTGIADDLADVGDRELDTLFLERIWQQPERRLFNRAFTGVGIGRLQIISFLVLLRGQVLQFCRPTAISGIKASWARPRR
jgi:hypothetical protein